MGEEAILEIREYFKENTKFAIKYFERIKNTRKSKKIALSVIKREIEYYKKYDSKLVLKAFNIHLEKYPHKRENYTRGIIRNLKIEEENGDIKEHNRIREKYENAKSRDRKLADALSI